MQNNLKPEAGDVLRAVDVMERYKFDRLLGERDWQVCKDYVRGTVNVLTTRAAAAVKMALEIEKSGLENPAALFSEAVSNYRLW